MFARALAELRALVRGLNPPALAERGLGDAIRALALIARWPPRGTVMDPEVVAKLLARRTRQQPGARLTDREREVLALMAEGRSNSAIAQRLSVSEKAVTKHSTSIFAKLGLPPSEDDNRRVLAVLAYLNA